MDAQKAVKLMLADAGMSTRDLAGAFNTTKAGAGTKISKGVYSIKDLLIIAEACGAKVKIELKSDLVLDLTREEEGEN